MKCSENKSDLVIHLAMCANESFGLYACVGAWSVSQMSKNCKVVLFFIDNGIKPQTKNRLERVFEKSQIEVHWIYPDKSCVEGIAFPEGSWLDDSSLLRLLLPQLIPHNVERFIYLDGDMLVQSDLEELMRIDLKDNIIAACRDFQYPTIGAARSANIMQQLGAQPDAPYFNAGLYVADMVAWRRDNVTSKTLEILKKHGQNLSHSDQDALNLALLGKWQELDLKWNVVSAMFASNVAHKLSQPSIIHFTGPKPGQPGCKHPWETFYLAQLWKSGYFKRNEYCFWFTSQLMKKLLHHARIRCGQFTRLIRLKAT